MVVIGDFIVEPQASVMVYALKQEFQLKEDIFLDVFHFLYNPNIVPFEEVFFEL